jgi:hypothetical protein
MTFRADMDLAALADDPDALGALADHAAAELAVMRDSAAAFLDRFAGGRGEDDRPRPGPHVRCAANIFARPRMPAPDPARRQPVRLSAAEDQAARLTGLLWQAIDFSGGTSTRTYRHFPAALDPAWLAGLPLPTTQALPPHQPAALTTRHLTRLAGGARVTCSVVESADGDVALAPHADAWFGVAVQVSGARHWHIGGQPTAATTQLPVLGVTTRPGDVLLVPKHLPHVASTPAGLGHSVHLAFALDRDQPGSAQP